MSSLRIITNPLKTTYKVGDLLDLGGIRLEYVDDKGKISYINASQIQPAEVSGFSTSKVNLNGRMVITKNLLSVVVHYNVEEGGIEPVPPTPPVEKTIEELLKEILQKMPVSTDTDGLEALLEEIKNKIPNSTDTDDIETLLQEIKNKIPSSTDTDEVEALLKEIKNKIPNGTDMDGVEALLEEIKNKIPHESDQVESLLQELISSGSRDSEKTQMILQQILSKVPEQSDEVEALLQQILEKIPEQSDQIEVLLREIKEKIPEESNQVEQLLEEIKEKIPEQSDQIEQLLQEIKETIPKSTSGELEEIQNILLKVLEKISPIDPKPSPPDIELISWEDFKTVLQTYIIDFAKDPGAVLLTLNMLKEWIWDGVTPQNLPSEIQKLVDGKSLTIETVVTAVLNGVFRMIAKNDLEEEDERFQDRAQYVIEMLKSLVLGMKFTLSQLITFAKKVLFIEQEKRYCAQMNITYNGIEDIGFDINWITQILSSISAEDFNKFITLDGLRDLITNNILKLDEISEFLPGIAEAGIEVADFLQTLIKEGRVDASGITNLLTKKLIDIEWVQKHAEEYGINLESIQNLLVNVSKGDFSQITDPELFEKFAKDTIPEPYSEYAIVASDLIRYPEDAIKTYGQEAMNWASSEADVYIQKGTDLLMTTLKGTAVGTFLEATGLDGVVAGGIQTLAITAKNAAMNAVGSLFGVSARVPNPLPYLQELVFKVAPEKAVYYIKENFNIDLLEFTAILSNGETRQLFSDSFNISGFDSSKFFDSAEIFRDIVIKLKSSVSLVNNFQVPRRLTTGEKELLKKSGKTVLRNYYGTIIASEEEVDTIKFPYQVLSIIPISFEMISPPNKTTYILGESFDTKGIIGMVTYSDNVTTQKITHEQNICISGFNNTKVGTFTGYCNYGKFSAPFEYSIIEGTPTSLILERTPDTPCFYIGDQININGISVKATYDSIFDESGNLLPIPLPAEYLSVPSKTFTEKVDSYNVELTYKGFSVNYSVRVVDYSLIFFQVMSTPAKETYIPEEKIVFDGLILAGIQGDTTTVQLNEENDEYVIAYYDPVPTRKYRTQYSSRTGKKMSVRQKIMSSSQEVEPNIEKDYDTLIRTKEPVRDGDFIVLLSSMVSKYPQYTSGEPGEYLIYFYTWEKIRDPNKESITPLNGAWGSLLRTRMTYYLKEEPANFYGYFVKKGENGTSMKERYINGDLIDLNGLVIEARYGLLLPDGTYSITETHVVDKSNFNFVYYYNDLPEITYTLDIPLSLGSISNRNFTIEGVSEKKPLYPVTYTLLIRNAVISGIEINKQNPKMKYTYRYKEEFDPSILDIHVIYSDGYQENLPLSKCTINTIDTTKVKKQKVIVYYMQFSDNYTISIEKGALQCISIRSEPLKMIYYVNEEFNTKGLEIYGIYDTGYEERISISDTRLHIVGFYSFRPQSNVHVYIDFSGQRAVIHPSVVERDVSYITLQSPPNKVLYQVGEIASWEGLIVQAHMEDGRVTNIPLSDLTLLGFDSTDPYGEIEIVVEYQGYDQSFSLSFPVFILSGELDHLLINGYPAKRNYGLYETIDLTGLSVLAVCKSNPTSFELPLSAFTITGFDTSIITGIDEAGKELERYVYLSISSQSDIKPISYSYKVHNHNLKEISIIAPICRFIPKSVLKESENGGYTTVSPENIPFKGGSLVEIYEIDNNVVEKKTDLIAALFANNEEGKEEEWDWKCTCTGDNTTIDTTENVIVTITRYINGIPVKSVRMKFPVLIKMGYWSTQYPNPELEADKTMQSGETIYYETPTSCFVGEKPSCENVNWKFYVFNDKHEPEEGTAFANTEKLPFYSPSTTVYSFSEIGVSYSYPDSTYPHVDKMSFISPFPDEEVYHEGTSRVNYYQVHIVDPSSKPKCLDILTLPHKLEYNLDDQIIDLEGIELIQVYQDQTYYPIETDDLRVLSFDTSSEGQHKVLFSALDNQVRLVYDIDVKAVPNALFINCMPNQTIYYNNTYTSPSLEGLEVQAQFKDLDSGYIWNQDIDSEELEIKTFDTSGPKSGERIENGSIRRLCAVMWRGAQTFFEYSVLIGSPVDSEMDLDENGYILKKQLRVDYNRPRVYLEDVFIYLIYPDRSKEKKPILEERLDLVTLLEGAIKSIRFDPNENEKDLFYQITYLEREYIFHYIVVKSGVYAITAFEGKEGDILNYITVSNSLSYQFNFDITVHYSDGDIEYLSIEDKDSFEVKEEFLKIGTRELYAGCIIYIKDGYYVPYDESYILPETIEIIQNGLKIRGIKGEDNIIYGYVYGVDTQNPPQLENNGYEWVIPTENLKYK